MSGLEASALGAPISLGACHHQPCTAYAMLSRPSQGMLGNTTAQVHKGWRTSEQPQPRPHLSSSVLPLASSFLSGGLLARLWICCNELKDTSALILVPNYLTEGQQALPGGGCGVAADKGARTRQDLTPSFFFRPPHPPPSSNPHHQPRPTPAAKRRRGCRRRHCEPSLPPALHRPAACASPLSTHPNNFPSASHPNPQRKPLQPAHNGRSRIPPPTGGCGHPRVLWCPTNVLDPLAVRWRLWQHLDGLAGPLLLRHAGE